MIWRECIPSQIHLVAERIREDDKAGLWVCTWHRMTGAVERLVQVCDTCNPSPRDARSIGYDSVVNTLLPEYPRTLSSKLVRHSHDCTLDRTVFLMPKTPVIAKVNQEARMLALEGRSKFYNQAFIYMDMSEMFYNIGESLVLVNGKDDTVLINTQFTADRHPLGAILRTEDGEWDYKANRLFGMITRTRIKVAIFAAVLIDSEAPPRLYYALADAKRVDVVVGVLRFHRMSNSEATTTDLFGLMGEQSMALIPVRDPQCLRKLFMAHAAFRTNCCAEYFSDDDADDIYSSYIPEEYWDWDRYQRPSDLEAYCEEMLGFAECMMTACEARLLSRHFDGDDGEAVTRQWRMKVEASFRDTFEPVFLVHRSLNPVLMDSREREDDFDF